MTTPTAPILFLGFIIVLLTILLLWVVMKRFRRQLGLQEAEKSKETDTTFIINAFHEVTRQLKEKERELERLKTLAEQRAESIENYNENILQCVTSGVMTFDSQFRLASINRAAGEMLGIAREQALSRSCEELFPGGNIAEAVKNTFLKGKPSSRMEELINRSGHSLWLGYNTTVLADRQNTAIGVIVSFSDLTEVKRLQERMELRERLTALGEMSAGIAHELRNPMAVISGYLNLLSKKADASGQDVIRKISEEISGMNRIISDLLSFARPAALDRVPVNLKQLLSSCSATINTKSGQPHRVIVGSMDEISVTIDEGLMAQAVSNIIQNGLEAMPDNNGAVTVDAVKLPEGVMITISDSGSGITADNLKKIFLPFFTTKDQGVGMGLALAHKIVSAHGGRIDAESSIGKGTKFRILLPVG